MEWAHRQGENHTTGSGILHGRLEAGQWSHLRLEDPQQDVRWLGDTVDRPLTLQLRPVLGDAGRWALHHSPEQLYVRSLEHAEDLGAVAVEGGALLVEPVDAHIRVDHTEALGRPGGPLQSTRAWFDAASGQPLRLERTRGRHRLEGQALRGTSDWSLSWRYGRPATETVHAEWTGSALGPVTYHHQIRWTTLQPCGTVEPGAPWTSSSDNPFLDALQDPAIAARDQLRWDLQTHETRLKKGLATTGFGVVLGAGFGALALTAPDSARRDINLVFSGVGGGVTLLGAGLSLGQIRPIRGLRASL